MVVMSLVEKRLYPGWIITFITANLQQVYVLFMEQVAVNINESVLNHHRDNIY